MSNTTYQQYLQTAFLNGNLTTEEVIEFILPLFEEVLSFHELNLVGSFEKQETIFLTDGRLDIDEIFTHEPHDNKDAVKALVRNRDIKGYKITNRVLIEDEISENSSKISNLEILSDPLASFDHPVYLPGYGSYEFKLGHHDAQTDIFCLGLILGSTIMGLDLYKLSDLEEFVKYRNQPSGRNPRVHPTVCMLVSEMTALDPADRHRDLQEIVNRLKNYRDFDPTHQTDLSRLALLEIKAPSDRKEFILSKLRNRLFDTSRRNRLLYYKPNTQLVNLTISSVPMVLHYQSILPEKLFTWNNEIAPEIIAMKDIPLNKYLRFEDHPYLDYQLNNIRLTAENDIKEFGFSQLKLAVAFLHWHNLKENIHERIQTPLLLLPVKIKRSKSLKENRYLLEIIDNSAVINPVLANQLKDLYGIQLPESIDFDDISMESFFDVLKAKINEAKQGVLLNYINVPRIKIVHNIARQTVNNYRKKLKIKETGGFRNIEYSYSEENYKPLGLELFKAKVESRKSMLEVLLGEQFIPPTANFSASAKTRSNATFQITDGENNPYSWDFDVCNIVLGNFNYKKMSLVRDYNKVTEDKIEHPVFTELFNDQPRQNQPEDITLPPSEWYHVISADPTQTNAILFSRKGNSYVIQGPPGTGKSQTITNLIADFLAQHKTILFVCEKRAALDVVYHRLQQNKLAELCSYIHDSQGDKKQFIKDLKIVYDDFLKNKMSLPDIEAKRNAALQKLHSGVSLLQSYHNTQKDITGEAGISTRHLLEKLISLNPAIPDLDPRQLELLPSYKHWLEFGETIELLGRNLQSTGAEPILSKHPFRHIGIAVLQSDNPFTLLSELEQHVNNTIRQLTDLISQYKIPSHHTSTLDNIKNLIEDSVILEPIAQSENLRIIDKKNEESIEFEKIYQRYRELKQAYENTLKANSNWHNKFDPNELRHAINIAAKHETSFFKFLNGDWRKLKKQLRLSYDFSSHQFQPAFSQILDQLSKEYVSHEELTNSEQFIKNKYGFDNVQNTYAGIEALRHKQGDAEIDYLLQHPSTNQLVVKLSKLNNLLHQLEISLEKLLHEYKNKSVQQIQDELDSISFNSIALKEMLPALRKFTSLPTTLQSAIRKIPVTPQQAEAAMAHKSLRLILERNPDFARTNMHSLQQAYHSIEEAYAELLQLNGDFIRASKRQKFLAAYDLSNMAAGTLTAEQKQQKRTYLEGRKVLEHEMSKSMRYKSIREMASDESGKVLKDIKPVWLMSPLSVSDSLPLDPQFFDVVIFDEASQITLEEGIPALFRARQTIIVGDDKQMPPSNFFSTKAEDPHDLETFENEKEDEILSAEADSLLVQGTRKLPSTMLSWHYRSRHESLISYSNHAFYNADLLTIPDKTIHQPDKPAIEVPHSDATISHTDIIRNNSISFHYLPNSVYEARSNINEARYIANMVRQLLLSDTKESIGVVAFSQEQQAIIEESIQQLAETDKPFEELLEKAYNRKDEGQFTGLFVKNLENVQGDERDIIIMSVCYGHDAQHKMRMNFGPINRKGGEKRLNVIFSRAKKHMAVVSSIKHHHITNEYNDGANYFKRFLHYAEMVSIGNMHHAQSILDNLITSELVNTPGANFNYTQTISEIKLAIENAGYFVDTAIGQSSFKCTIGIKTGLNDQHYRLGILVDDDYHYQNNNLIEQYYQRPAILKSFGWEIIPIYAKDWLENKQQVLNNIISKLGGEPLERSNIVAASVPLFIDLANVIRLISADEEQFWEIRQEEVKLIIRFGRINTTGQVEIKSFANDQEAAVMREAYLQEKIASGFRLL